ncbi:MAG: shikimate kinase [Methanomassiliicoccales archaeon]|nr:MAG: shikimate kinase [Methanomassiliicoccales archaeon]
MKGSGIARGAGTVINAMATGKGCAFGIDIRTEADVELNDTGEIEVVIEGHPEEPTRLIELCVGGILEKFGRQGTGAKVVTRSQIPISRGLKSSSAAANAVIKATLRAIGEDMQVLDAIRFGCEKAIEAGVSVTGAFDDACASMLGGVVLTDNANFEIIRRERMDASLVALIYVPDRMIRKTGLPLSRIRANADLIELAYILAMHGDYRTAMKLNGMVYSSVLGVDPSVMHEALEKGAVAAGLSGTGPATVMLVERERAEKLRSSLSVSEKIIVAELYNCD